MVSRTRIWGVTWRIWGGDGNDKEAIRKTINTSCYDKPIVRPINKDETVTVMNHLCIQFRVAEAEELASANWICADEWRSGGTLIVSWTISALQFRIRDAEELVGANWSGGTPIVSWTISTLQFRIMEAEELVGANWISGDEWWSGGVPFSSPTM
jgi:hypothetical protein